MISCFVFEIFDLQLLGWFPFMCDHCSGRLSGGSHRSLGEAEKRVQKSGLSRQLVWTVCGRERREPIIGSVRRDADPNRTVCARHVDAVLTHGERRRRKKKNQRREKKKERKDRVKDQTNHQHKNKKISNDDQKSSSPKWIYKPISSGEKDVFLQETMARRSLLGMLKHICLTLGRFHEIFIRYWVEMTAWISERSWLEA